MHYYLWIPFSLILATTLFLFFVFCFYFYYQKKLKTTYKKIRKIDLFINHPINEIFSKKIFILMIQPYFIKVINNLIHEIRKQIEDQQDLLKKQAFLIKSLDFLKWRSINRCITLNQKIIDQNIMQFNEWNNKFWKIYNQLDYNETKAFIINEKINNIYDDFIVKKQKIDNQNYQKGSKRMIELFNGIQNTKVLVDLRNYNHLLNQMIHQIENKIHLISNIFESLQNKKHLYKIIDLVNRQIKNNNFLKQERIEFIMTRSKLIANELEEPFLELINNSKFKLFREERLKFFKEELNDFLSEVTKTKKSHEIFDKYRNKFINDFDWFKRNINLIDNFVNDLEEKTKNISFLDFHSDLLNFKNGIFVLKEMQIDQVEITESASFIKKTHKFYSQLNKTIAEFYVLIEKINFEITEFNKINLLINNNKNMYYELSNFIENQDFELKEAMNNIIKVDLEFINEYETILENRSQSSLRTTKQEIIDSLNSINKRFSDLIDFVNLSQIKLSAIYTHLINKAVYFDINPVEIVNKFSIENIYDYNVIKTKIMNLINLINHKKKNWIG